MAAQMDVALELKAEAKELRGPNSRMTVLSSFAAVSEVDSRRKPSRSNVSRRSHSNRWVDTSSSVDPSAS